jgi:hypothetical protein
LSNPTLSPAKIVANARLIPGIIDRD